MNTQQIDLSSITRGTYDEINLSSLDPQLKQSVLDLIDRAADADKIDEHGSWDFSAAFDKKGRGQAINWDLYGVGYDCHSGQLLIVVQIRKYEKRHKNWFPSIRKNYFLVGTNEDGTTFAHSVSHAPIFAAIRAERDVVRAVQNWIFGGDYCAMIRQGDLALIPMKSRPAGTKGQLRKSAVLEDSHELSATQIANVEGRIYAKNPTLVHQPGTHSTVSGLGWYRVIVGKRASFWKFAAPTID
jgi:hypothetical protein